MRAHAHDVGLHSNRRAAALARSCLDGREKLKPDAAAANRLVDDEALEVSAESFNEGGVGRQRRPSYHAIGVGRDEDLASFS